MSIELLFFMTLLVQSSLNGILVLALVRQQRTLFNAAMSRTPSEYRRLEGKATPKADGKRTNEEAIDAAAAEVLASMSEPSMPHGLGGD